MLTHEVTLDDIKNWQAVWAKYKEKLKPNRKASTEVLNFMKEKYVLRQLKDDKALKKDDKALKVVTDNVMLNEPLREKLQKGECPNSIAFIVENEGNGAKLYQSQDETLGKMEIFVGVDAVTGHFCVEGSNFLWDELFAFRGLDAVDIEDYYLVVEYVACMERFAMPLDVI